MPVIWIAGKAYRRVEYDTEADLESAIVEVQHRLFEAVRQEDRYVSVRIAESLPSVLSSFVMYRISRAAFLRRACPWTSRAWISIFRPAGLRSVRLHQPAEPQCIAERAGVLEVWGIPF